MNQTIVPVAALVVVTLIGIGALRRFPARLRFAFDGVCFAAASSYFLWQRIFPIFPPLGLDADLGAVSLRMVGGAWWVFGARLAVATLWVAVGRSENFRQTHLFSDLGAAVVYIAASLIVLNSVFALPVTGVIATSGVVAIVLGLALQNTLADVFAGIAVGIEGPFRVGDRIRLNDTLEGGVVQVNWRSIRLQTDGDDTATIPNSIVAKATIINCSFPSQRRAASVELSCPESALPERVLETLRDATLLCPDILHTPAPSVVINQLGPKRNLYKISFQVASTSKLTATTDLLLRVSRRQLHYAGLLDKKRHEERTNYDGSGDALSARRLLRDVIVFESLSDEQIAALLRQLELRRLEPGEVLFLEGEADKALYLVASGVIEIQRSAGDFKETLGCIGAGEYIGEIGLLTGAAHAATARSITYCEVYRLPHNALVHLLEQNADLVTAFDKSVRKGLAILHRGVVARSAPETGAPGQLIARIRHFFKSD